MTTVMPPPRLIDAQVENGAAALARAFFDDPLQMYMLPDPAERKRLSPAIFTRLLRYGQLFGEVYTTPGTARAAAVWLPPGQTDMPPERMEQAGLMELPGIVGDAFDRFGGVMDFLDPLHKRDAPGPHWYLGMIGVDPSLQGSGVGRALIEHVVAPADAAGVPCFLETAQPKNVQFYINRGFVVMADVVEPESGLQLWTFLRTPA